MVNFHKHDFKLVQHHVNGAILEAKSGSTKIDAFIVPVDDMGDDSPFRGKDSGYEGTLFATAVGTNSGHLPTKEGEAVLSWDAQGTAFVFCHVGNKVLPSEWQKAINSAIDLLIPVKTVCHIGIVIPTKRSVGKLCDELRLVAASLTFKLARRWTAKTKVEDSHNISSITWVMRHDSATNPEDYEEVLNRATDAGWAKAWAQMLNDLPANFLTPKSFGYEVEEQVKAIGNKKLRVKVHGLKEIQELNMGSFLAVSQGSAEKPKLITLEYNGGVGKPIVLVGKGLTFDSGGISIKPSNGMGDMKGDMAGAASALAAVLYAARAGLKLNVVAVAACCENMPAGCALKPGDVITAMSGTTIEVIDTDAEGRLVLADALEFSKRYEGRVTIDLATLTGACITALGHTHTGLFTTDDALAEELLKAGVEAQDVAWRLPLGPEHESMLDSKVADISNLCLGKGAGSTGGAVFLQRFAPDNWAHLDIAGTSAAKGGAGTGRPVDLLTRYLDKQ